MSSSVRSVWKADTVESLFFPSIFVLTSYFLDKFCFKYYLNSIKSLRNNSLLWLLLPLDTARHSKSKEKITKKHLNELKIQNVNVRVCYLRTNIHLENILTQF